jgi:threonine dehydrogenase-like Zn-dependent dehydrogenase
VVIQAAAAVAIPEGLELARPAGRFLCIGGGGKASVPTDLFVKNITVLGIRGGVGRHYHAALTYLDAHRDRGFERLLSAPYPLEGTAQALQGLEQLREIKPVITPVAA